jgi:hypothetical protein
MSAGADLVSGTSSFDVSVDQARAYRLFASLATTACPDRPSGEKVTEQTVCYAMVSLQCEKFPEDGDLPTDLIYISSTFSECEFTGLDFIWGQNFELDNELLAVMAGIFGLMDINLYGDGVVEFNLNGALAALFALGSLVKEHSIEVKVRPEINTWYVTSMLIPVFLSLVCLVVILLLYDKQLPVPQTTWQFLVFGRENPDIPTRRSKKDKFPPPQQDMSLEYGVVTSERNTKALIVTSNTIASSLQKNAILEVPVPLEEDETSEIKVEERDDGGTTLPTGAEPSTHSSNNAGTIARDDEEVPSGANGYHRV